MVTRLMPRPVIYHAISQLACRLIPGLAVGFALLLAYGIATF